MPAPILALQQQQPQLASMIPIKTVHAAQDPALHARLYALLDLLVTYFAKENFKNTLTGYVAAGQKLEAQRATDSGMDCEAASSEFIAGMVGNSPSPSQQWIPIAYLASLKRVRSVSKNPLEVLSAAAILAPSLFECSHDLTQLTLAIASDPAFVVPQDVSIKTRADFPLAAVAASFLNETVSNNVVLAVTGGSLDPKLTTTTEVSHIFQKYGPIANVVNKSTSEHACFYVHCGDYQTICRILAESKSPLGISYEGETLNIRCDSSMPLDFENTSQSATAQTGMTSSMNDDSMDGGDMELEPDYSFDAKLRDSALSTACLFIEPSTIKAALKNMPLLTKVAESNERQTMKNNAASSYPAKKVLKFSVPMTPASVDMDFGSLTIKKFVDCYCSSVARVDITEQDTRSSFTGIDDSTTQKYAVRGVIKLKSPLAVDLVSILQREGTINGIKIDFSLMTKEEEKIWWILENQRLEIERKKKELPKKVDSALNEWLQGTEAENKLELQKFADNGKMFAPADIPTFGKRASRRARNKKKMQKLNGFNKKNRCKNASSSTLTSTADDKPKGISSNSTRRSEVLRRTIGKKGSIVGGSGKGHTPSISAAQAALGSTSTGKSSKIHDMLEDIVSTLEKF